MPILDREDLEKWKVFLSKSNFEFNDSFERIRELTEAVEVLTEALEIYPKMAATEQHIDCDCCLCKAKIALEKVWGEDEN